MKEKSLTLISIIFMVFLFLIYNCNNLLFYSEVKYGDLHEHFDLKMQGVKFNISHYIVDDKSQLVISEEIYGIGFKMPTGKYYLFPLHSYQSSPNNMARGSLKSLASPLSLYIYEIHNKKNNVVAFFNDNRGFINVNGETIHLSSLFLGVQGEHIHTSYHDVS
ncbi:PsaF/MyfF family fimbrial adhesin regulatory protein [Yersinia similis]|uniref:Protein psaF n=1 Tax=Yersinia similis TaxID=367190 RepID=A0A0T9P122_9GAMM|nr:PsaF/MyfF family fimbrial adhesin regulatory protein [Yersinia similis]AHK20578.1 protein psaF [Yersinia similis]CFQ46111.1 protein psaF [Yersinia similis]CNB24262.1 protein psaF [Yersinia similis]CNE13394.1 protein psaF [Yersinia similis]CNF28240.1 protein psaF [Yersinia similis]